MGARCGIIVLPVLENESMKTLTRKSGRQEELLAILNDNRIETEQRYKQVLAEQQSGAAGGDNEGVHGWKASREGGTDFALLEALDETLRQIDSAVQRLHTGRYGICAGSEKPIPQARLKAVPYATKCVPSQSRSEQSH